MKLICWLIGCDYMRVKGSGPFRCRRCNAEFDKRNLDGIFGRLLNWIIGGS